MIGENTQSVIIQKNFSPQNRKVYIVYAWNALYEGTLWSY